MPMGLGPIISRELMVIARRKRSYGKRTMVPAILLLVVLANDYGWRLYNGGPSTIREIALFGGLTFAQFVAAQILVTIYLIPELISRSIADERDRKTLGFLLTTRLSSGEIVLGKLGAGLWQYLGCVAAGLPVVLLLPLFGGVEPGLALLAYAGTASTALFLAGLSVLSSVVARRGREAHRIAFGLVWAWMLGPAIVTLSVSSLAPRLYPWVRPVNELVLASSPMGVFLSMVGAVPRGAWLEVVGRMIGLQLAAAGLLVLGASARLRPAFRRHEEGESRPRAGRSSTRRRPPCGDRPMIWKERHVESPRGLVLVLGVLAGLAVLGGVGTLTIFAGSEAVREVLANGYGSGSPDTGRTFFNHYLRLMTVLITFVSTMILTGFAVEGITIERTKETWLSLIATPMEGREIIRGKMFGAFWRARGVVVLLVALWSLGLLAGAVHPLGFALALIGLTALTWFCMALGVYASLRTTNLSMATTVALLPVLALDLSGLLPRGLPKPINSVVLGAGSMPLLECLALMSYGDVRAMTTAYGSPAPMLEVLGIASGELPSRIVLTYALGVIGTALAGLLLERLAERQFDRLIGRPWRPSGGARGDPKRDG